MRIQNGRRCSCSPPGLLSHSSIPVFSAHAGLMLFILLPRKGNIFPAARNWDCSSASRNFRETGISIQKYGVHTIAPITQSVASRPYHSLGAAITPVTFIASTLFSISARFGQLT